MRTAGSIRKLGNTPLAIRRSLGWPGSRNEDAVSISMIGWDG